MPTNDFGINTRSDYIEIGTGYDSSNYEMQNKLTLPAPTGIPSSNNFGADAGRNADYTMIIQQIGRTQYKAKISWNMLPSEKWWEINRWFEDNGYIFWMKYFEHTTGKIKLQRFYRGNVDEAEPSAVQKIVDGISIPKTYKKCGFSIIDMGEYDSVILKTFPISEV